MFKRLAACFCRPWFGFLLIGVVVAVAVVAALNAGFAYTNRTEFCISCHEMEENVYAEYKETYHYNNRTGVRTECKDCHVPKEFFPKLWAKIRASKDVYHHFMGTIDTEEKFEAHRLTMAKAVWRKMEATNSRECRNCHAFEAMELIDQSRRARRKHTQAMDSGETCIDCHKGIAHDLPRDYAGD